MNFNNEVKMPSIKSLIIMCFQFGFKLNIDSFYKYVVQAGKNVYYFTFKDDIDKIKQVVRKIFEKNIEAIISVDPVPFIPTAKEKYPIVLSDESIIYVLVY